MSVKIMAEGRAVSAGGRVRRRSAGAIEGDQHLLVLHRPFEVLADRGHRDPHIAVCSYLNWIGDAQVRFARLEGDLAGAQHQADDLSWSDTLSRARLVARRP
jgi:hypothetical protein